MSLAAALLLFAATVSPLEQTYGPYARPITGFAPATAVTSRGVLVAWSEIDAAKGRAQIRTAMLDREGRIATPIRTIASDGYAMWPSLATNGTTFQLAFLETVQKLQQTMTVDLDANGAPVAAPRQFRARAASEAAPRPQVFWNGREFEVAEPANNGVAIASRGMAFSSWFSLQNIFYCCCFGWCQVVGTYYDLTWSTQGVTRRENARHDAVSPPAASAIGETFYIAWTSPKGVWYSMVRNNAVVGGTLIPAPADLTYAPGIGCDSTDCLIAWSTTAGDIYAMILD
ncbi:MAG: hypothetical protein ACLGH0_05280, partial [Thermoanaerobaculia bacterium]